MYYVEKRIKDNIVLTKENIQHCLIQILMCSLNKGFIEQFRPKN